MGTHFSACEIVEMGIQIEKNGFDFYTILAETIKDKKVADVFKYLAGEEEKHIKLFKDLFKQTCEYEPEGAYPDDYFSFMNALAGQYVFTKTDQGKKMAAEVKDVEEGVDLGIKAEKDAIIFYSEMKIYVPDKDKILIEELIQEEKKHLIKLCEIKGGTQGEECKGI